MSAAPRAIRIRVEDVSAERMEGDVIAVNLHTGSYFSLSGPAADVWTACATGAAFEECCAVLDDSYASPVPRDQVMAVVESCIEHGLFEEIEPLDVEVPALPDDWQRGQWTEPKLEVFDDLKDLILVDPIHDASALGWPRTATLDD